jgi:hypothetical protein
LKIHSSNFSRVKDINNLRHQSGGVTLLDVLRRFRDLEATDKRDIIYAALCLATDIPRGSIIPNPQKTLSELHRDVAIFYIENSLDPLDILGDSSRVSPSGFLSQTVPFFRTSFEFASWIPQWVIGIPGLSHLPKHFITENAAVPDNTVPQQVEILGSTLVTQGLPIDYIKNTAEKPCLSNDHERAREFICQWAPINRTEIYLPTVETMMAAFLRLIVVDLSEGDPPTERGGSAAWDHDASKLVTGDVNDIQSNRATSRCQMRTLATSESGYMALVFLEARAGDIIFALRGGSMLYVLRPKGDEYLFIGECYVYGFMDGEALKLLENGTAAIREVHIV